ncbi:hypothetical protein [Tahibacter soli]|uniref:Preprotein translocase subunit SecB n=1 Tax=Tahibacter soli TaxID=2983605 RepID=A0A9X4BIE7_9GAMM|nr:hypothetical protein [Tahibacter soli]MDC8013871.1 hypothetical protein [Tahibacter soli]
MTLNAKLDRAVKCLFIEDVVLKSIDARLNDDVRPGINLFPNDRVSIQMRGPTCVAIVPYKHVSDDKERVVFEVQMALRILRGTTETLAAFTKDEIDTYVLATIETSFFCYYEQRTPDDAPLDAESLVEFGAHNVTFQLWPYWREAVHAACSRMCLPRIVLPTYRLKKSAEAPSPASPPAQAQLSLTPNDAPPSSI